MKARDSFEKVSASKAKIVVGMSAHGKRIIFVDKNNKHTDFPTCNVEESWEHVRLCDKNKQIRDEWIKSAKSKFIEIIQK